MANIYDGCETNDEFIYSVFDKNLFVGITEEKFVRNVLIREY